MVSKEFSFTAASSIPLKIFLNYDVAKSIEEKKFIPPVHIQLNPENACNQNCPWCSCKNRDKKQRLSYEEIMEVFKLGKKYGTKSTTITGGGETLLHPRINDIIVDLKKLGIDIGLVTNGWYIEKLSKEVLDSITWVRVSLGDKQIAKPESWWKKLEKAIELGNKIDWSFSYVLTSEPEIELIKKMIEFANKHKFTHIRVVSDIFNADKLAPVMERVKKRIRKEIDDSLVIWQSRGTWTKGTKECYISLLKPVLGADGLWYSCCGNQYMLEKPTYNYVMPMSKYRCAEGLKDIIENQRYFDGSICVKCYYQNYNYFLKVLMEGIKHKTFM
jgi:MoaA/NifB/PqqE/SkfB family radical SAM enzyme